MFWERKFLENMVHKKKVSFILIHLFNELISTVWGFLTNTVQVNEFLGFLSVKKITVKTLTG